MCCRLYPFILMDNRKEGLENLYVDVAHIGCVDAPHQHPSERKVLRRMGCTIENAHLPCADE